MKLIACIDKKYGTMFNHRRQTSDKKVTKDILEYTKDQKLWMNSYSYTLFEPFHPDNVIVDEDFLEKAGADDFVFIEGQTAIGLDLSEIILYRWDKEYPQDEKLDIYFGRKQLFDLYIFEGNSHDEICREIYR